LPAARIPAQRTSPHRAGVARAREETGARAIKLERRFVARIEGGKVRPSTSAQERFAQGGSRSVRTKATCKPVTDSTQPALSDAIACRNVGGYRIRKDAGRASARFLRARRRKGNARLHAGQGSGRSQPELSSSGTPAYALMDSRALRRTASARFESGGW
jgi:hypothetical protein